MNENIERILVSLDGSEDSESVLPAIMPVVRAYAPVVTVLYVCEDPEASLAPPERVAKACSALRSTNVNAHLELRQGLPSEEIVRAARDKKADLIAISTHGRGGAIRIIAGSVAEEVLRHAEVPVLITRPSTLVHETTRLVIALDGSERSEEILPDVQRLARKLNATVDVIRAVQPATVAGIGEAPMLLPPEDVLPYLKGVVKRLEAEGLKANAAALEGRAADAILQYVSETHASLLCMATHGRSGLARILLGSVAEEVVRKAPCPVLLRRSVAPTAAAKPGRKKKGVRIY
jgi:nucleotide-binding universal stress UspA family protein